jgi:hypothetical protein
MSPEEARRHAVIKLGRVESTKEDYRDRRGLPVLETLMQDLRFGFRSLRKNPGFSAVFIVTLALGIGVDTGIFSAVYGVLLRPLLYQDGRRLVVLHQQATQAHVSNVLTNSTSRSSKVDSGVDWWCVRQSIRLA